jgi:glycosyltransferase involved in cell wall biosynthesis
VRICLYTHTAYPLIGGQEAVVDALARQYLENGHEVCVLAPRPTRWRRSDDRSFPYTVVRHPRFISMRHFVAWYRWWLLGLDRRRQFDIVHSHSIYPCGYVTASCGRQCGFRHVLTSHGEDVGAAPRLADPKVRRRHVLAVKAADALIAISPFTRDGYLDLCPDAAGRISDVSNGVDVDALTRPAPRPAALDEVIQPNGYLLFLGRLVPRKGVDVLLRALAQVPANGCLPLVVAGAGPERARLEDLAGELGVRDRVRFIGVALGATKSYLLQNARCSVVPSVGWEGQGIVIIEAFAAGHPVIASDLRGFVGLVEPGKNGWLVPPGSVEALAQVLARVMHQGVPAHLRAGAVQTGRPRSWAAVARQHLAVYENILARPSQRRAA